MCVCDDDCYTCINNKIIFFRDKVGEKRMSPLLSQILNKVHTKIKLKTWKEQTFTLLEQNTSSTNKLKQDFPFVHLVKGKIMN